MAQMIAAAAAAALAEGIGNFGRANPPPRGTAARLLVGFAGQPIANAPREYLVAAQAEGLRPCFECQKLPFIDPLKHFCDGCARPIHAFCGSAVEGVVNRCLECCRAHGVPPNATNPVALALPTRQSMPEFPLADIPVNRGPNQVGIDPGTGARRKKRRKRNVQAVPNVGVIPADNIEFSEAPAEVAVAPHSEYHSTLIQFMSFHLKRDFAHDQQFSPELMRKIKPHHIVDWMHFKAYGKSKVNYKDFNDKPVHQRHTSLNRAKSALSYYMPDKAKWNDTLQSGNPTTSDKVAKVISRVRDMELKGMGAEAKQKRDLSEKEFRLMCDLFRRVRDLFSAIMCTCYAVLAFHLVFRSDDVSWLKFSDVKAHSQFDFALKLQVIWSKNVKDGHACPDQILLGSMETYFCALLNLALFMEEAAARGRASAGREEAFLFTTDQSKDAKGKPLGPGRCNKSFQNICRKIFKKCQEMVDLVASIGGSLGSHSIRKFASTFARRLGKLPGDVEFRGRWKGDESKHKIINGSYISPDQPFIDADVAACLCHNQPISYRPHPAATGVTPAWLREHVVPHLDHFYGGENNPLNPSLVLAYPLLWAAMSPEMEGRMDPVQRERIQGAYQDIDTLPEGVNPVVRVNLHVRRMKDLLVIDEMTPTAATPTTAATTATPVTPHRGMATTPIGDQSIVEQMFSNHQQLVSMINNQDQVYQSMFSNLRTDVMGKLKSMDQHICR